MSSDDSSRNKKEGAELLVSLVLFLISAGFLYFSIVMERPEDGWRTAPGLLPAILSASLCVMAGAVILSSIRRGGLAALIGPHEGGGIAGFMRQSWRLLVAMLAVALLYFGLMRFLPFEIAAVLFFVFMTRVFWSGAGWPKCIAVSLAVPLVIATIFQAGFGIPMPGQDNLVERLVFLLR